MRCFGGSPPPANFPEQHQFIFGKPGQRQAVGLVIAIKDAGVDLARPEPAAQVTRQAFEHMDLSAWEFDLEGLQQRQREHRGHTYGDTDGDFPRHVGGVANFATSQLELGTDLPGMIQEDLATGRQRHAACVAQKELDPKIRFQGRNLAGQCRLGDVATCCGFCDASMSRNILKMHELFEIHGCAIAAGIDPPAILKSDRSQRNLLFDEF